MTSRRRSRSCRNAVALSRPFVAYDVIFYSESRSRRPF
jgi:hypothetical protein